MPRRRKPAQPQATLLAILLLALGIVIGWWLKPWDRTKPKEIARKPVWSVETSQKVEAVEAPPALTNRVILPAPLPTTNPLSPPTTTNKQVVATSTSPPPHRISLPTSDNFPRPARNTFEIQWVLARHGFSPGPLDGVMGSQTRNALAAFQEKNGFSPTGEPDPAIRDLLLVLEPPLTNYSLASNDLLRLQPVAKTWLGKSQQNRLDFETVPELIAETSWSHPNLIRRLNPEINWTNLVAGTSVIIPQAKRPVLRSRVAGIRIYLSQRTLQATNEAGQVLLHFPCSIAQKVEKRPIGVLSIIAVAPNPNYLFDPANFPESEEAAALGRKLILPPGPNNPVGTAWISLDRPGYGIHGTPRPEEVGRTESHGCFRLANWNAETLLSVVRLGLPVHVLP